MLFDKLSELNENHIDTIRIDSFLHDEQWTIKMTKLYLSGLKSLENGSFNDKLIQETNIEDKLSHGFYSMNKQDMIYLVKEDTYE
jgi:collagenase-like PrtC family protease